jgi:hypothetical protein
MQEPKERLPSREGNYEPEPETVAGFIVDMSNKIDELLATVNWQPNLE